MQDFSAYSILFEGYFMNSFPDFRTIVASFAPGWFASVMGTGVLAMTTRTLSLRWTWLAPAAEALHWFNIGMFLLIAIPWLLRWFQHTDKALATFRHPMQSPFYATLTVALLVMAAQTLNFGLGEELARAIWWCASVMTFALNFIILFRLFTGEDAAMEHMTAAHFIPAVGLVVIPVAGIPLLNGVEGLAHDLALLVNIAGLGAGFLLYLGLFCLLFQKHLLHAPFPGKLIPTVWIQMAPLCWTAFSLMQTADALGGSAALAAMLMWGASLWWFLMAVLLTFTAWRRGTLVFSLVWWSFIFPLGALTTLSLKLGSAGLPLGGELGVLLWALLVTAWAVTMARTLRRVLNGSIFTA